jgi:hypothetical protein
MVSLLFVLGILIGIVGAAVAVSAVAIAVARAAAWANATIVGARHAARRAQSTG